MSENGKRVNVSAEQFVRIWQSATSTKEVGEKTGLKATSILARASLLRKKGVNLKKMGRLPGTGGGRRLDVANLNNIIAEAAMTTEETDTQTQEG